MAEPPAKKRSAIGTPVSDGGPYGKIAPARAETPSTPPSTGVNQAACEETFPYRASAVRNGNAYLPANVT